MSITAYNAWKYRMLKDGKNVTEESIILESMPSHSSIKREDLFREIFKKIGTQYDNDDVRTKFDYALHNMVEGGSLRHPSCGYYELA